MRLPENEAKHFIALYTALIGWCSGRLDAKASVRDARSFLDASMDAKAEARDRMLDDPKVIDEFVAENPHDFGPDDLSLVSAWRTFVRGNLVVERDLKRYTVFIAWTEAPVAYAVLSLTEEIIDLIPTPLPILVEAVLLPWKGVIACDGLLRYKTHFGPGIRRQMKEAYRVAKARGIATRIGADPGPAPTEKTPISSKAKKPARSGGKPDSRGQPRGTKARFVGKWSIIEMDHFDQDDFEMEGPAHVKIEKRGVGRFHFGLVSGEMDCRFSTEHGQPLMEFSWDGNDEHHAVMGRGRATIDDKGTMKGRIYTHHADDTGFTAKRVVGKRRACPGKVS